MEIIPFGKYKGQPIEVLASDKQYIEWLVQQDWFKQRYQSLNAIIINNFQAQQETPEHNKIQAMFTDDEFLKRLCELILTQQPDLLWKEEFKKFSNANDFFNDLKNKSIIPYCVFEHEGVDVKLSISKFIEDNTFSMTREPIKIEIKQTIGDDYPSVLRQMHANGSTILICENYNGTTVSINQIRKMFEPKKIFFINEI